MTVMIDVDDVMHPLNETACKMLGIGYHKLTDYNLSKCTQLQDYEAKALVEAYQDIEIFKDSWRDLSSREVAAIKELDDIGTVHINSISWTEEIKEFKKDKLEKSLDFLPDSRIHLGVKNAGGDKDMMVCDIAIEDCYYNIVRAREMSAAVGVNTIGILILKPYNYQYNTMQMVNENILIVKNLSEALAVAKKIMLDRVDIAEDV